MKLDNAYHCCEGTVSYGLSRASALPGMLLFIDRFKCMPLLYCSLWILALTILRALRVY